MKKEDSLGSLLMNLDVGKIESGVARVSWMALPGTSLLTAHRENTLGLNFVTQKSRAENYAVAGLFDFVKVAYFVSFGYPLYEMIFG